MSEVILYDTTTYSTLFEFDADTKETRKTIARWTDKPVENGANLSDRGYLPPEQITVEGILTAWPMLGVTNPLHITQLDSALRGIVQALQPVGLATKWWALEVVLDSVDASQGQGDGEKLRVSIQAHPPNIPTSTYVEIPAAKLKASVKKRATPKSAKGGAAAGKSGTPNSWAKQITASGPAKAIRGLFGL